jgi:uncharacterized protein YbjT (DUF2867 family)
MNKKVLVIGGTGMLGKPVALKLKEAGFNVVVFTRNSKMARIKMPSSFEFAQGDVEDPGSLQAAMEGCYGVHINLHGGKKGNDFDKIERQGTVNIVMAAKKVGVQKISIITGTSVSEHNTWYPMTKAKFEAEEAIRKSGIAYTIFRPSWFYESLPMFVRKGKAMTIGSNPNKYHWLAARDYAELVSKSYQQNTADNKTLYVYGPETYSINEALVKYCELKHPEMKVSNVSPGLLGFLGTITFNPLLKFASSFAKYFETVSEMHDDSETIKLLGKSETTLADWVNTN